MNRGLYFGDTEGLAGNLVEGFGVDEILVAQNRLELAGIHFGNKDSFVALEQRSQIAWQRPEVADVNVADIGPADAGALDALLDRAECGAPANDSELSTRSAERDVLLGDEVGDAVDLGFARVGHFLMVGRVIGDLARAIVPLDAADPVGQAGGPGLDPNAFQRLLIPRVRIDAAFGRRLIVKFDGEAFQRRKIRQPPSLRGVGHVAIRQQDDRRHELHGQTHRLDRRTRSSRPGCAPR